MVLRTEAPRSMFLLPRRCVSTDRFVASQRIQGGVNNTIEMTRDAWMHDLDTFADPQKKKVDEREERLYF
jgi:hypothetical protein